MKVLTTFAGCIAFLVLLNFYKVWERIGGLWLPVIVLFTLLIFLWLTTNLFKSLVGMIVGHKKIDNTEFVAACFIIGALLLPFFKTFATEIDKMLFGKPVLKACHQGHAIKTTFTLRENNAFEICTAGTFLSSEVFEGSYQQQGDTLFLRYRYRSNGLVGNAVIIDRTQALLIPFDRSLHQTKRTVFHFGDCDKDN